MHVNGKSRIAVAALLAVLSGAEIVDAQPTAPGVSPVATARTSAQAGSARSASARGPSQGVLITAKQIRELTLDEAREARPVHLRGIVTYYGPVGPGAFLQDSTGGIYVDMHDVPQSVVPHDVLDVWGVSGAPDFAPEVDHPTFTIVGKASFPVPRRVTFERLASTQEDSQWVEVDGIIRSASLSGDTAVLQAAVEGGRVMVRVPHVTGASVEGLVDARVLVRGACGTLFNAKNQLVGVRLNVPSLDEIQVTESASPDPFDLPVRPIADLLKFAPQGSFGHRIRVRGVVLLHRPAQWLFIHDQTQGVYIPWVAASSPLPPGETVDVVGFPAVGDYTPVLEDAIARRVGPGHLPPFKEVAASDAVRGTFDTDPVTVEGWLREKIHRGEDQDLVLQQGDIVFVVRLADDLGGEVLSRLRLGSKLRVSGVCSVDVDRSREPRGFEILLSSPQRVVVLSRPSWWTAQRTLSGVAALALAILAAMAWAFTLRRRVREQTELIRRRLGSEAMLKRHFQDLFDNASDIFYTLDLEGKLTSLNKAGERLTGYRRKEVLGRNLADSLPTGKRERFRAALVRASQGEELETDEWTIATKDGRPLSLEVSYQIIRENGKPVGIHGVARDITQRRLTEEALRNAKDAAEAASRAKSEFLANMSHEIRTPMNGIIGMTELALDTELNHEQRNYLEAVKASGESLLTVINDVLDLSKIEAGKLDLVPAAFSLEGCLSDCFNPLAFRADQKGLELSCDIRPEVPEEIVADPARLRQVLINLLGNAIKFTERGEVGLEISARLGESGRAELRFAVRDTGIGIPAEKQRVIFEAFTQADSSAARKFGGTGLGLTISSRLIEAMGGDISVESAPGRGSCFTCVVPVSTPPGAAKRPEARPAALDGGRILVADDSATSRRILAGCFERWGAQTVLAASADEALGCVERAERDAAPFALLVVDARMPGKDGFELVEAGRRVFERWPPTLVIVSAATRQADAARCRRLGVATHLTKPTLPGELLAGVHEVLGLQDSTADASAPNVVGAGARHGVPPLESQTEAARHLRVLLAEDNPVNQTLAVRLLQKRGHAVEVAGTGREALVRLESGGFDLVILDVQMPEMDGFETARQIRAREDGTGAHIPILAMTAHAMQGDRERCLAAGMDGYISKPIRSQELFAEIAAHVPAT